jgi:hypothetical protein
MAASVEDPNGDKGIKTIWQPHHLPISPQEAFPPLEREVGAGWLFAVSGQLQDEPVEVV